jgi:hypothetical protein
MLKKGLAYPDFPCAKFKFKEKNLKVTNNLCSLTKLVDDIVILPNLYSIAYASHYGIFSIWHSMSYDPSKTVKEIRDEIIDHLMILAKLSLIDTTKDKDGFVPNIFWLGMVLHTIMDSYSPAHLLRNDTLPNIDYRVLINKFLPSFSRKLDDKMKYYLDIIDDLKTEVSPIARFIDDGDEDELNEVVTKICKKYNIKTAKKIKQMAQLSKFFYFHSNKLDSYYDKRDTILKSSSKKKIPKSKHPIINFYYYPAQKGNFHKKNDLIFYCKKYHLYDDCIKDIAYVLEEYMKVISLESYGDDDVKVFLSKIYSYLSYKTYAIHPKCENFNSGLDIIEYKDIAKEKKPLCNKFKKGGHI